MNGGEIDFMDRVDKDDRVHEATVEDEERTLQGLYGDPDENGFYTATNEFDSSDLTDYAREQGVEKEPKEGA